MLNWKPLFRSHILERGREYANFGAVRDLVKTDDSISAVVQGGEYYKVRIRYSGTEITDGYCSCPYASKGEWCKHMAAVLYKTDSSETSDESLGTFDMTTEVQSIKDLINSADRKELQELLLELACRDDKTESFIRSNLGKDKSSDVKQTENEIEEVFRAYSDQSGFIDYYNAMSFETDLNNLLRNRIGALIDNDEYMAGFDASMYAYTKLGNWGMDDDGEIASISSTCYELWQDIVSNCEPQDRESIKEWFEEHSEDGTVIDYMEETLQDFLKYELASEYELKKIIKDLESKVENSNGQTKCQTVYTSYYGYNIEAIELRNILIKRLGATDDEIEEYMKKYMSFRSVRDYFINKAREYGDIAEEIRLLKLGKEYEKKSEYTSHSYSKRLIEIYALNNDKKSEKQERRADLLANQSASLEDFKAYHSLCTSDEWAKERVKIIESRESIDKKCEFLAEEKMQTELFNTIREQKDRINFLNKYGFALEESYSSEVLEYYSEFVSELAKYACNRSRYDELRRYLMRMSQYPGGQQRVRQLAAQWIDLYPTRKVMVQMLQEF